MRKNYLAGAAIVALLAGPAFAQDTAPAPDAPPADEAPLMLEDDAPAAPLGEPADPMMADEGEWEEQPVELAQVTAEELIGSDVRTYDDERIARVDDVLIGADGEIDSLIVTFGGFLGFGSSTVELGADEVELFRGMGDAITVRTDLTPEALEERPEYES